jgi:hypothetical protein
MLVPASPGSIVASRIEDPHNSPAATPVGKHNHHGILYRELISRRAIVF